jgi:hypothetical protein
MITRDFIEEVTNNKQEFKMLIEGQHLENYKNHEADNYVFRGCSFEGKLDIRGDGIKFINCSFKVNKNQFKLRVPNALISGCDFPREIIWLYGEASSWRKNLLEVNNTPYFYWHRILGKIIMPIRRLLKLEKD